MLNAPAAQKPRENRSHKNTAQHAHKQKPSSGRLTITTAKKTTMPEFNYQKMIDDLITREGGYVGNPDEHGGPTIYGITQKMISLYSGKPIEGEAFETLTRQTARDFYYSRFYITTGINLLPESLRPILFDMTVHSSRIGGMHGDKHGIKSLQAALIDNGYSCETKENKPDGNIKPATISAANAAWHDMGNELIRKIVRRRIIYFEGIVRQSEINRIFLPDWIKRAELFLPEAEL